MSDSVAAQKVDGGEFAVLCIGGFLLSIAYGVTFLIPVLVGERGGDEALAGLIISAATVSTVILVILSGHIADAIGSARAVAVSGLFLAASALGFAMVPSAGLSLMAVGFILGIGWGTFYALGPILVAAIVEPEHRIRFFALLSGSMMSGIGAGPIIGRIATSWSMPIEAAFAFAFLASLAGGALYFLLHIRLTNAGKILPHVNKISFGSAREVIGSRAIYSIIMVGIGGAIFGGLSSFQTSYAKAHGFDYSLFFIGFMSAAILSRLFVAGYVVKKDPLYSLLVLTSLTLASILLFLMLTSNQLAYLGGATMLGVGYGLTYSVINGLAANEAPAGLMPQSLLLFSLAYSIGVFGFPLIAGNLIVSAGIQTMLCVLLLLAVLNLAIVLFRVAHRATQERNKASVGDNTSTL
ncbi:MFS transporter [Rhizobium johnstonii]|uniref:MFS transporter n=1 Tax=Rhizobium leguminosarum bv. viciae TaxID=387 RepID=A0A8G2J147_RHILV|nr:MFS transporter [Rhizobium leguminosarum]MBY5386033.1 MFS transporter [Rhizobium leguminosarum]MBY5423181.1 MFS transporter [Rhizobium leguminosarum]MCA2435986.1 MFS transporter [Rhizobium leguminosarum]NEH44616.1 MFS transporter [Rhizobium leguminosarum]NEH74008.1 MFS transporter [Rhizobium leguminosarum]